MAKEEVGKQRIHIDLVGSTNMGTSMAKVSIKPKQKTRSFPKSKSIKTVSKSKNVIKRANEIKKPIEKPPIRPPGQLPGRPDENAPKKKP